MDQLGRDLQLQPTASQVPLVDIVTYWMGDVAKDVFVVIVVFSIFALDVVGLAATGRLIFSFARDNIIPFSSALKKVNPQTQTPIRALATASGLGLVFVAWGYISAVTGKGNTAFLVLITATATLPFVVYFLNAMAPQHVVFRRASRTPSGRCDRQYNDDDQVGAPEVLRDHQRPERDDGPGECPVSTSALGRSP